MVCHKCLVCVENCVEFRDKCWKNDERLRLIFKVNESATEESTEPVLDNSGEAELVEEEEAEIITLNPNKLYESSDESEDERIEQIQTQAPAQPPVVPAVAKDLTPPLPVQMNDHNKREIYHCRFCDVVFSDSLACSSHEQSNHERTHPYKCILCSYKTDQHPTLIFHIKQTHNLDKPFLCTQCSKTFMRRSDLRKHTFVHAGIRLYSCDICKKSFTRNTNLTKHKRTHFPNAEKVKNWKCQLCPRAFFSNSDLLLHMEIHLDQKSLICKHCNQAFPRRDQLELHQKTHFEKNTVLQIEMEVPHPQTAPVHPQPIVFYNQPQEQPTMNFYTENTPYKAPLNGAHLDYQQNQTYTALQPKKEYPIMNQLLAGLNMNAMMQPTKNFICCICTHAFSKKKELDRHVMTVHTTVKQFKCGQCSKSFNRKDKLLRHEKIHSAPPVYNCSLCTAVFLRKQMLDQHSKSHMVENGKNSMASLQPLMPDINGFANAYNSDAMQHRMSEIMQPADPDPPATLYPMNLSFDRSLNEPMNLSNDKVEPSAVVMKIEPATKPAAYSDDEADELRIAEDLPAVKSEMFQSFSDARREYEAEAFPASFNPDSMMRHDQFIQTSEVRERFEPETDRRSDSPSVHVAEPVILSVQENTEKRFKNAVHEQQTEISPVFEPEIQEKFSVEVTSVPQPDVQTRLNEDFVGDNEPKEAHLEMETCDEPQSYPQSTVPAPELKPNYEDLIKRVDDVAFPMTTRIGELEKLELLPPMEILNND